jgi:hypothetical protein
MEKEFVPYDRSVKLKQLGFDLPTFGYYQSTRLKLQFPLLKSETQPQTYMREEDCSAPTYSQAFRWFREEHQLDTSINTVYSKYNDTISKKYGGVIDDKSVFTNVSFYDTYEEVELDCLDKLIEIVESKNK